MGPRAFALLAGPLLVLACGNSLRMPQYSEVVGTYRQELPASSAGVSMVLFLNDDFTAEMITDYVNDQPSSVETGSWMIEEDGAVKVRLSETQGVTMYPVIEIFFALRGSTLDSVEWDRTIYGDEALTFRRY